MVLRGRAMRRNPKDKKNMSYCKNVVVLIGDRFVV
jgi:hypothetical protein